MNIKYKSYQTYILGIITVLLLIAIITSPDRSFESALSGIKLWFNVVLPSLLPFFIVSEFVTGIGVVDFIAVLLNPLMEPLFRCPGSSSFIWAMSSISGYPSGARLVSMFISKRKLNPVEGQRILSFSSTSGPLFMIGAVAVGMLGNLTAGKVIVLSHYLAAIILGLTFRHYKKEKERVLHKQKHSFSRAISKMNEARMADGRSLGELLGDSVSNSVHTLLMIGGFIVIFSVIIDQLIRFNVIAGVSNFISMLITTVKIDSDFINGIVGGLFEVTLGSRMISQSSVPLIQKTAAASFLIGWSGFSIHAQVASLLSKRNINMGLYIITKLFHGLLAAILSYPVAYLFFPDTLEVFHPSKPIKILDFKYYIINSTSLALWTLVLIFSISIMVNFISCFKHFIGRKIRII